jgi:imidazolonepropionase-like amidohydrolase
VISIRSALVLVSLAGACSRPAAPEAPVAAAVVAPAAVDLAIRGVRVFDGSAVLEHATVEVRGGVVVRVGGDGPDAPATTVIDGAGMTLMPGLIDAHVHLAGPDGLRQALAFGVTTELDMFALPAVLTALRRLGRGEGGAAMADFRSAGILATAPGGHGTEYGYEIPTITGPEQAQAFVDARIAEGADYLKIVYDDGSAFARSMPTVTAATLAALVVAAHARGKLAVVHVSSQREAIAAIEAGADGLAHIFFDAPPSREFVELAARREVFVADTLPVIFSMCDGTRGDALIADAELGPLLPPREALALKTSIRGRMKAAPSCEAPLQAVRELHAAGVRILASTDAANPGTAHGVSLHDELELLVRAGLRPQAALVAATTAPAAAFGLADRGSIAAGKRADLVLVRGDPTRDIRATRAIVAVWKQGARLDRAAVITAVAQLQAEQAALRAASPPPGSASGKISDFNRGDLAAAFGAGWAPSTDALIGGSSTVTLEPRARGALRTRHALRVAGTVAGGGAAQWAGAMFSPGASAMAPANLASFKVLTFWARADREIEVTVMLFAGQLGASPGRRPITVGPRWEQHRVALTELAAIEPYDVMGLFVGATRVGAFSFEVDELRLE